MTEQDIELLARFVDGELADADADAFAHRLEAEPALAEAHADLIGMRSFLQADVQAAVERADFSSFFERIEAQLPAEMAMSAAEAAPTVAKPAARAPTAPSAWERIRTWVGRNWGPMLIGAAAAAAVAFFVTRGGTPGALEGPTGTGPVVVDAVTNDGNKTVLISMPAEEEEEGATVIWLLDEEDDAQPLDGEDPI